MYKLFSHAPTRAIWATYKCMAPSRCYSYLRMPLKRESTYFNPPSPKTRGPDSDTNSATGASVCAPEVYEQRFWMAHYGSGSPKRTKVFSNSKAIAALCRGRLTKCQKKHLTVKTTVRTKSGGYQGSKDLKKTQ